MSRGPERIPVVGISAIDAENRWVGGRYYLQHLVRAVASLPAAERVAFASLWWDRPPATDDPFAEIAPLLDGRRILRLPQSFGARLLRRTRRALHGWRDARDLFVDAGVDALFPIAPCAAPGIPLIAWIADFQHERMPELFTPELRALFQARFRNYAREATLIVVSSRDALRDLEEFIPAGSGKGRVLPFCSIPTPEWWSSDPAAVQARMDLPDRFLILSNQFSAQKNHLTAFEAVRRLRERGREVTVVCTGSTYGFHGDGYFRDIERFLDEHRLRGLIRIAGLLPREQQVALMRRSLAMLQPSRFEGWSTVVEDAKTLGKKLIVSDIAVHREQAPPNAVFVAPDDPAAWADAIEEVWSSRAPGPHPSEEEQGRDYVQHAQLHFGRGFVRIVGEAIQIASRT